MVYTRDKTAVRKRLNSSGDKMYPRTTPVDVWKLPLRPSLVTTRLVNLEHISLIRLDFSVEFFNEEDNLKAFSSIKVKCFFEVNEELV